MIGAHRPIVKGRVLNARLDPLNHAKMPLHPVHFTAHAKLPASTNNRANTIPIQDQETIGSCTAFSSTGNVQACLHVIGADPGRLSELLQYQLELIEQGDFGNDDGSTIPTAFSVLAKHGYGLGKEYPYVIANFDKMPSKAVLTKAATRKLPSIDAHRLLQDLNALKQALFCKWEISFAAQIPNSFMSDQVAQTGIWSGPEANDPIVGGHAIRLCDFDDTAFNGAGGFWIANSWGTVWGAKGYVLVPYSWIMSPTVGDFTAVVMTRK